MTATYKITKDEKFSGASIFVNGEPYAVASDNLNYREIVDHLINEVDDDERLLSLINPGVAASDALRKLSERVSIAGHTILFDGDPIESAIADHIVRIISAPGTNESDYISLVRFLEKVATNPSKKSRKHLYHFVEANRMTIHEDGDLIAYKGVRHDGRSSNAGYGIVDGVVFENDHLLNEVGSIIEIPRSMVNADRGVHCSTGLHVGTYGYASSFAPKLLTVKVNPRDVVAVPDDHNSAKVRVARYVVLEENNGEYTDATLKAKDDNDFVADVPVEEEPDDETVDLNDETPIFTFIVGGGLPQPGDDDDETELSDEEIHANTKIAEFKNTITFLADKDLRRHRNKKITAKNRPLFDRAVLESKRNYV